MEDRGVLLQLIEDYPNLINSLETVTDLWGWSGDLSTAIGSVHSDDNYEIAENLKFLILYSFNKEGFFIHITKSKAKFLIQLNYTKGKIPPQGKKEALFVFPWYHSPHNNEQVLREKLLKSIIRDFSPSIPKEKEMLQEVIYNCKVILSEVKV